MFTLTLDGRNSPRSILKTCIFLRKFSWKDTICPFNIHFQNPLTSIAAKNLDVLEYNKVSHLSIYGDLTLYWITNIKITLSINNVFPPILLRSYQVSEFVSQYSTLIIQVGNSLELTHETSSTPTLFLTYNRIRAHISYSDFIGALAKVDPIVLREREQKLLRALNSCKQVEVDFRDLERCIEKMHKATAKSLFDRIGEISDLLRSCVLVRSSITITNM